MSGELPSNIIIIQEDVPGLEGIDQLAEINNLPIDEMVLLLAKAGIRFSAAASETDTVIRLNSDEIKNVAFRPDGTVELHGD